MQNLQATAEKGAGVFEGDCRTDECAVVHRVRRAGPRPDDFCLEMKLPNAEFATVPERKVTHYLLNPAHPAGGSKAWFFLRFGFTVAEWRKLADALLRHARENEVAETEQTPHGQRYVVD